MKASTTTAVLAAVCLALTATAADGQDTVPTTSEAKNAKPVEVEESDDPFDKLISAEFHIGIDSRYMTYGMIDGKDPIVVPGAQVTFFDWVYFGVESIFDVTKGNGKRGGYGNRAGRWTTLDSIVGVAHEFELGEKVGKLDPYDYAIESVMPNRSDVLKYEYDYGDGWEIIVTRMADPMSDEITCVETVGTNAMEDIGGPPGLEGFIEALKECKLKGTDDDPDYDGDWRIQEWGYDDPEERRKFLAGPTLEELTKLLRNEISASRERTARRKEMVARERLFKKVGRNDPCPCGSGKKFKKCCGK